MEVRNMKFEDFINVNIGDNLEIRCANGTVVNCILVDRDRLHLYIRTFYGNNGVIPISNIRNYKIMKG